MLNKCANPACRARLMRFPDGRLFLHQRKCEPAEQPCGSGRCHESYWLCGTCATTLTVVFAREGVFVRPRRTRFPYDDLSGVA